MFASTLKHRLLILMAAATLLFSTGAVSADEGEINQARSELQQTLEEVSSIEAQILDLEDTLEQQAATVESLKKQDAIVGMQDALRETRSTAEALSRLTVRLRDAQARQEQTQTFLMRAYDAHIVELEQQIFEVDLSQQPAIIAELERLQVQRESARAAAHSSTFEPIAIPELAELTSDDPEELQAAAEELEASELEVNSQLQSLNMQIDALEQRRRVLAYAEDSTDERSIFGEEDTPTKISGQKRVATTATETRPSALDNTGTAKTSDEGATQGITAEGGMPADNFENTAPPAQPEEPSAGADPDNDDGAAADFAATPDRDAENMGFSTDGDGVTLEGMGDRSVDESMDAPEIGTEPESSSPLSVIRSDADPNALEKRSGSYGSRGGLDRKLKSLKNRKKKLERSLDEVRNQKERLEERANELGF